MKRIEAFRLVALVLFAVFAVAASGCAPLFSNARQFNEGSWHLWASQEQVVRMQQDKMVLTKLHALPIRGTTDNNGVIQGLKVTVKNVSTQSIYNVRIVGGPDEFSVPMAPGKKTTIYLIPGSYTAIQEYRGAVISRKPLTIGLKQFEDYDGEKVHNYILLE